MINLRSVSRFFDKNHVLKNIDLTIESGEFVSLLGLNGVGKSTLAHIVAGIDLSFSGHYSSLRSGNLKSPMIFQDYRSSLLPWFSIFGNVTFPLKLMGVPLEERVRRFDLLVDRIPARLDLQTSVCNLSGGQAQLVGILRAFIVRPDIIVCDEPFSALDYWARVELRQLIVDLASQEKCALFFISHDLEDALFIGDRAIILSGHPAQVIAEFALSKTREDRISWLESQPGIETRRDISALLGRMSELAG